MQNIIYIDFKMVKIFAEIKYMFYGFTIIYMSIFFI